MPISAVQRHVKGQGHGIRRQRHDCSFEVDPRWCNELSSTITGLCHVAPGTPACATITSLCHVAAEPTDCATITSLCHVAPGLPERSMRFSRLCGSFWPTTRHKATHPVCVKVGLPPGPATSCHQDQLVLATRTSTSLCSISKIFVAPLAKGKPRMIEQGLLRNWMG